MIGMAHGTGSASGLDEGPSTRQTGGSGKSLKEVGTLPGGREKAKAAKKKKGKLAKLLTGNKKKAPKRRRVKR